MKEKRTDVDFGKHVLTTKKNGDVAIYSLVVPGSRMESVIFINAEGILAVTGDYGNWIFCREFHPGPEESVCDHYWTQKLKIASCQDPYQFDSDVARQEIEELLKNQDYEFSDEEKEWLEELSVEANQGEYSYIAKAMDRPSSFESEMVPKGKTLNVWLKIIFDAFDEICNRVKN